MEEERRKVLQMLAEGQITPAQANEFLEVLGTQQDGGETQSSQQNPEAADRGPFGKLTIDQAVRAKMFGLDAGFVREMKEAGFPELSFDQLIEGKMQGLDARFVREMQSTGLPKLSFDQIVQAKIFGLDAQFVRVVQAEGLGDLSFDKLIEMKMHGVDVTYLREMGVV